MYDAPWARGIVGKQVSVEGIAQQTRNGRSASAAEVAALAGVSRQTVSRVVNGVPNVTEKTRKPRGKDPVTVLLCPACKHEEPMG